VAVDSGVAVGRQGPRTPVRFCRSNGDAGCGYPGALAECNRWF